MEGSDVLVQRVGVEALFRMHNDMHIDFDKFGHPLGLR